MVVAWGINLECQWYLYEQVQQHIRNPLKKETFCSQPDAPKLKKYKKLKDVANNG